MVSQKEFDDAMSDLGTAERKVDLLRKALTEFATYENWSLGRRFDANSPNFDGTSFAQFALDATD